MIQLSKMFSSSREILLKYIKHRIFWLRRFRNPQIGIKTTIWLNQNNENLKTNFFLQKLHLTKQNYIYSMVACI